MVPIYAQFTEETNLSSFSNSFDAIVIGKPQFKDTIKQVAPALRDSGRVVMMAVSNNDCNMLKSLSCLVDDNTSVSFFMYFTFEVFLTYIDL